MSKWGSIEYLAVMRTRLILERLLEVRFGGAAHDTCLPFVQPFVAVAQVALDIRVRYLTVHAVHAPRVRYLPTR